MTSMILSASGARSDAYFDVAVPSLITESGLGLALEFFGTIPNRENFSIANGMGKSTYRRTYLYLAIAIALGID